MAEVSWGGRKGADWLEPTRVLCDGPGLGYVGWCGAIKPAVSRGEKWEVSPRDFTEKDEKCKNSILNEVQVGKGGGRVNRNSPDLEARDSSSRTPQF